MAYQFIILEKEGRVGTITLNRPPANPIHLGLLEDLSAALTELENDKETRAIILTGAGDRMFSAGFDLKTAGTPESFKTGPRGHEIFRRIERLKKPVIAAINGHAQGGGLELALVCHFRVMVESDTAQIGLPEIKRGLIPGWGGTQRLPRLIGKTNALKLLLTGDTIKASEAHRLGIITQVSQPGELMKDARALANLLAGQAPVALRCILDSVSRGLEMDNMAGAIEIEMENSSIVAKSKDVIEGAMAFIEKRAPNWTGE